MFWHVWVMRHRICISPIGAFSGHPRPPRVRAPVYPGVLAGIHWVASDAQAGWCHVDVAHTRILQAWVMQKSFWEAAKLRLCCPNGCLDKSKTRSVDGSMSARQKVPPPHVQASDFRQSCKGLTLATTRAGGEEAVRSLKKRSSRVRIKKTRAFIISWRTWPAPRLCERKPSHLHTFETCQKKHKNFICTKQNLLRPIAASSYSHCHHNQTEQFDNLVFACVPSTKIVIEPPLQASGTHTTAGGSDAATKRVWTPRRLADASSCFFLSNFPDSITMSHVSW